MRVESILHVTLADDADVADNLDGEFAKHVVVFVGKSLRWSDYDTFAGVDTERVEVFHVADCDTVVKAVAHYFIFHFFPALERLFDEDLW